MPELASRQRYPTPARKKFGANVCDNGNGQSATDNAKGDLRVRVAGVAKAAVGLAQARPRPLQFPYHVMP